MAGTKAVIIQLLGDGGDVVDYTCADGTAISKGTLLKMADAGTVSATSATADPFAGIAAEDKVANNGVTRIATYTNGIFDLKCDGAAITAGNMVAVSGADIIRAAVEADFPLGAVIGQSLETAAVNVAEVIAVKVLV